MSETELLDRVRRRLAAQSVEPTPSRIAAAVRAEGGTLAPADGLSLLQRLQDDLLGAGPLAPLLRDTAVTDVLVNAADEVWVDRGHGLEPAGISFVDDHDVRRLVARLLAPTGRRLDDAQPWVDARLPDGTRLHAILAPIASRGTCISLRTLGRQHFTLADLAAAGSATPCVVEVLEAVVQARLSVLISGGTGTGKTTLLSCLLGLVDEAERIVIVEDSAELRPTCRHVVRLEARPPNVDGAGEVTLRDLVRQAMRMRPDRLVVGEVRGAEVAEMLAALNTGHDGGLSTVHANTSRDVPARLEALGSVAGMTRDALHAQAAAALDVVVHLRRARNGLRTIDEIGMVKRGADGLVAVCCAVEAGGPAEGWADLIELLGGRDVHLR